MAAPRYQPGNRKRYACPTCHRRFATWASIHQHSAVMHGTVPDLLRCDLVLRAERRRLAAEGVPEEGLPVVMPARKAVSDCEEVEV